MIAQLTGKVARFVGNAVVLDVQGVGYKVFVPVSVIERLPINGEIVTLITHTQVREDDLSLFGFLDEIDQRLFELLITVPGVGPKMALALLSAMPSEELARVISSGDTRTLSKAPGVGAKTAQRVVLDLRDKLAALGFERKVEALAARQDIKTKDATQEVVDDVISALENLGYNKTEARRAAELTRDEKLKAGATLTFPDLLRTTLNRLTRA